MNKYAKLHLETVEIPPNYIEIMERESVWDYDMFDFFSQHMRNHKRDLL